MVMYCNNCNSTFADGRTEHVARDYKRCVLRPCGHDDGIYNQSLAKIEHQTPEHFPILLVRLWFEKRKDIGCSPYGQLPVAHVPLRVYGSPSELECRNETKRLVLTNTDAPNFALL